MVMDGSGMGEVRDGQRVLVVDRELNQSEAVIAGLRGAGFRVSVVQTGEAALRAVVKERPEVVVLEMMLPDLSGIEICRRIRGTASVEDCGIVMHTARGEEFDRLLGFEAGADDYVVKPFSARELVLRVTALSRRVRELRRARRRLPDRSVLAWRGLAVDPGRQQVFIDGREAPLRPLEYKLLALFIEHPEKIWSRAELLRRIWGISGDVQTRTVDTHVRRLRERLAAYGEAVETVHGLGYRLRAPAD